MFKVGDKVRVVSTIPSGIHYGGPHWSPAMTQYLGCFGTVVSDMSQEDSKQFLLKHDAVRVNLKEGVTFTFKKDWLVPVNSSGSSEVDGSVATTTTTTTEWTDTHYDAYYTLTPKDIENGKVKIDPYRVSKQWRLGAKDESGALFHILKTLARFGEKNSREREIKALYAQIKCLAEIEGVEL